MDESQEEQAEQASLLPALPVSREQLLLTGGTLLTSGIIDAATHFNGTTMFVGALATFVVARHSQDILERLAPPGHQAAQVYETTNRIINRVAPPVEVPTEQDALSKLKRLFGLHARPAVVWEEEVGANEPGDGTRTSDSVAEPAPTSTASLDVVERLFPQVPLDEQLTLGKASKTRQRFDPPLNQILGKGLLLAGSQGTGKSNILGLIAYSAGRCGMPFLLIDYKGEFHPVIDVVPNGIIAGHPSMSDEVGSGFFPLTVQSAGDLATILMESPFQVVLDVPSYNGDNDEVAQVIAAVLQGLMDWSRQMRRTGKEPWPCLVITDEAHNFLPQAQRLSALAMKKPSESFAVLTGAYSRMANTGRSFGYTLVMATQRLPNIAKWSIANLQIKIVLAHAEKNDLDACEEETGGLVDREEIKRLERGKGIVVGLTRDPMIVRFDKQPARHVSTTPALERLHSQFQGTTKQRLSRVLARSSHSSDQEGRTMPDQDRFPMPSAPEKTPPAPQRQVSPSLDTHRGAWDAPYRTDHEQSAQTMPTAATGRFTATLPPELRRAWEVYRPGMTYRELSQAANYSEREGRERWLELKRRGLLHAPATSAELPQQTHVLSQVPHLRSLPRPGEKEKASQDDAKQRPMESADLAKAFALWQAGASSVRKLEAAAKAAGYGWSNVRCRSLIEEMEKCGLIQAKREPGVL